MIGTLAPFPGPAEAQRLHLLQTCDTLCSRVLSQASLVSPASRYKALRCVFRLYREEGDGAALDEAAFLDFLTHHYCALFGLPAPLLRAEYEMLRASKRNQPLLLLVLLSPALDHVLCVQEGQGSPSLSLPFHGLPPGSSVEALAQKLAARDFGISPLSGGLVRAGGSRAPLVLPLLAGCRGYICCFHIMAEGQEAARGVSLGVERLLSPSLLHVYDSEWAQTRRAVQRAISSPAPIPPAPCMVLVPGDAVPRAGGGEETEPQAPLPHYIPLPLLADEDGVSSPGPLPSVASALFEAVDILRASLALPRLRVRGLIR